MYIIELMPLIARYFYGVLFGVQTAIEDPALGSRWS
jgi:hypothetical protein